MIPCIAIPFLNRKDLLQRCVSSIDFPVNKLLIVNNGSESLHDLKVPKLVNSWDEKVGQGNLGVAGSWNYALNYAFNVHRMEYVLIVGNDIQFSPGDLDLMHKAANEPDVDFVSGNWAFSTWGLTRKGFGRLGWLDESIHPAYGEDVDYWYRAALTPGFKVASADTNAIHGEAPHWGSSTIYSDPALRKANEKTHNSNLSYLERKWGWNRHESMASAKFLRPFNDSTRPVWDWALTEDRKKQPHFRTHG